MPLPQEKYYTVEEFYNLPEDIHAELINGQIFYMATPSHLHQDISGELYTTIKNYIKSKDGTCRVYAAPFSVQLHEEDDTILEPDISVICDTNKFTSRGCTGAPDWIVEIVSPSNPGHDYITKLGLYHDAGVREYWIVDAQREHVYVYNMDNDNLILNAYSFSNTIKVGIYEDLYIDFSSLDIGI
ncbi:MAG: Uma2 family endonuclease [Lachnospiraceae bacterium]|nr:Uma2 family endonuclease [Lachnospiraceae bacterium]